MRKFATSVIAVLLALLSGGVAHADGNDDDFVQAVDNNGVTGAPADLIRNAHAVCAGLDDGNSPDAIRDALVSQLSLRADRAAIFVALSATHYCAQYGDLKFETGS